MGRYDIGWSSTQPPIQQGATFTLNGTAYDGSTSTPYNFTGYSIAGKLRKHYDSTAAAASFTASFLAATAGTFRVQLSSTVTGALSEGYYVYDVEATSTSVPKVVRVLEGRALVSPQATY